MPLMSCAAWILFIKMMFVSANDGRRSFLLCFVHKWTKNEFKSDKFRHRRLSHLCLILQSNMIYGINSFLHSHLRLWSQTRIWLWWSQSGPNNGPSHTEKVFKAWTFSMAFFYFIFLVAKRKRRTKTKKSHEYFYFLWFFVNETVHWFSFGPCPRNHQHQQHRKTHILQSTNIFPCIHIERVTFPWPKTITTCVNQSTFSQRNLIQLVRLFWSLHVKCGCVGAHSVD